MTEPAAWVLVTDRNKNVREFLHRELLYRGYRAKVARTAGDVLAEMQGKNPPALLVLDIDLPGCEGPDFYGQLLAPGHTTFVLVHGFSERDLPAPLSGKAGKISKDGNVESFVRAISWCLSRACH